CAAKVSLEDQGTCDFFDRVLCVRDSWRRDSLFCGWGTAWVVIASNYFFYSHQSGFCLWRNRNASITALELVVHSRFMRIEYRYFALATVHETHTGVRHQAK